jgi:hypothetical protein
MSAGPGLSGGIKSSCNGIQTGGGTSGCVGKVGVSVGSGGIRRVLRMPWRGRFMCPFAVAGLGLRYLRINFSDKLGHPLRNPLRTALRSVDIFGLHNDWCANLTLLARVRTECMNAANVTPGCMSAGMLRRARSNIGASHGRADCVAIIGRVHKSVVTSLNPRRITCPL